MGFNYIGDMDIMNAHDWTIADNVFMNINGPTGEARGAVFLWHNGMDCVINRNFMIDCDSGICLGNSSVRGERRHANHGLIVVNNLFSGPRIVVEQTVGELEIRDNLIHPKKGGVAGWSRDAAVGDLHLTEKAHGAFDKAAPSPTVIEDIDRQTRGSLPDFGADEFSASSRR